MTNSKTITLNNGDVWKVDQEVYYEYPQGHTREGERIYGNVKYADIEGDWLVVDQGDSLFVANPERLVKTG